MPKTKQQKAETLRQLADRLRSMKSVVFSGYKGLTVNELTALRRELRKEGVELTVVKRTLFQKAVKEVGLSEVPEDVFEGGIQLAFATEDEVAGARILYEFGKKHEGLELRGGYLGTEVLSKEQVTTLAKLPGKEALRSQLVGVLAGPMRGLVTVLAGPMRGLVTVLQKRSERTTA